VVGDLLTKRDADSMLATSVEARLDKDVAAYRKAIKMSTPTSYPK
jgi:hypothetical protein